MITRLVPRRSLARMFSTKFYQIEDGSLDFATMQFKIMIHKNNKLIEKQQSKDVSVSQLYHVRPEDTLSEERGDKLVIANLMVSVLLLGHSALNNAVFGTFFGSFSFIVMHLYRMYSHRLRCNKIHQVWINQELNHLYLKYFGSETYEEVLVSDFLPKQDFQPIMNNSMIMRV